MGPAARDPSSDGEHHQDHGRARSARPREPRRQGDGLEGRLERGLRAWPARRRDAHRAATPRTGACGLVERRGVRARRAHRWDDACVRPRDEREGGRTGSERHPILQSPRAGRPRTPEHGDRHRVAHEHSDEEPRVSADRLAQERHASGVQEAQGPQGREHQRIARRVSRHAGRQNGLYRRREVRRGHDRRAQRHSAYGSRARRAQQQGAVHHLEAAAQLGVQAPETADGRDRHRDRRRGATRGRSVSPRAGAFRRDHLGGCVRHRRSGPSLAFASAAGGSAGVRGAGAGPDRTDVRASGLWPASRS